ncbi:hypothetical protein [Enterococcus faecium]|nr:hypothetical protein [Enterococcus faecium]
MFDSSGEKIIRDLDKQLPYDPKPLPSNLDNVMKLIMIKYGLT